VEYRYKMKNKEQIKKLIAVILVLLMLVANTGCATWDNFKSAFLDEKEEIESIKIGVLEPITGTDAVGASEEIKGIELAHQMFPTLNNRRIELVYADNGSDVELCPTAAQSLIDSGCCVILGSYKSVLTLSSSDVIQDGHIAAITITNTNPIVTKTNPYYFRVCCIDSYEGEIAARFVNEQLQTTKVAILMKDNDDYSSAMATEFINKSEEISEENGYMETYTFPEHTEDFGELLTNIYQASPDAIFFPSAIDVAEKVLAAAQMLGYDFTWVGTSKWEGIEFENAYYTLDYDPTKATTQMAENFQKAYMNAYGYDNPPSDSVALGFDAYLLALKGIEIDLSDEEISLVTALGLVENLECATGYLTMSSSGDPIKEIVVEKYEDGSHSVVYTMLPEKSSRDEQGEIQ